MKFELNLYWTLFSAVENFKSRRMSIVKPRIHHDGNVTLNIAAVLQTACKVNVASYPADEQKCDMVFASWGHHAGEIRIKSMVKFAHQHLTCIIILTVLEFAHG
jgi:hypothetical protein